jgi:hypothetical protein
MPSIFLQLLVQFTHSTLLNTNGEDDKQIIKSGDQRPLKKTGRYRKAIRVGQAF